MTASAIAFNSPPEFRPSAIDVFCERAEARAILVEACAMDLQEAVDGLQEAAWQSGLAKDIGQNAVQAIMARAFHWVVRS
jgi:hypothetical protein